MLIIVDLCPFSGKDYPSVSFAPPHRAVRDHDAKQAVIIVSHLIPTAADWPFLGDGSFSHITSVLSTGTLSVPMVAAIVVDIVSPSEWDCECVLYDSPSRRSLLLSGATAMEIE